MVSGEATNQPGHARRSGRGSRFERDRAAGPRRVRHGLKLRSRDGVIPRGPLADRWIEGLEAVIAPKELEEGRRYARLGQTVSMTIIPGGVDAVVQGSRVKPHAVRITVGAYPEETWGRIIETMAGEASYLVKLPAGDMPEGLETMLRTMDLELVPRSRHWAEGACDCAAGTRCRHVATVGYLMAERLALEPLTALELRGLAAAQVVDRLRHARAMRGGGVASAHVDPLIPESQREPIPLEACLDDYWRMGPELLHAPPAPPAHHVPQALLRRLGPSPLKGEFPLVGLMASVYDVASESARRWRAEAEGIGNGGDDGET